MQWSLNLHWRTVGLKGEEHRIGSHAPLIPYLLAMGPQRTLFSSCVLWSWQQHPPGLGEPTIQHAVDIMLRPGALQSTHRKWSQAQQVQAMGKNLAHPLFHRDSLICGVSAKCCNSNYAGPTRRVKWVRKRKRESRKLAKLEAWYLSSSFWVASLCKISSSCIHVATSGIIINEVLLHSTGNYIQSFRTEHDGREYEEKNIYDWAT